MIVTGSGLIMLGLVFVFLAGDLWGVFFVLLGLLLLAGRPGARSWD